MAPEHMCSREPELLVTRTVSGGRQHVFQTPVTPPECRWTIADVPPGNYQAVLRLAHGDQRIVAMAHTEVHPASTWTMSVSPLAGTVEGLISVGGIPAGRGVFVQVIQNGAPGWAWDTRTDSDGYYTLAVAPDDSLCVRVTLPNALNFKSSRCGGFGPGVNRRDFDIPPGRIDVTLVPRDGPIHHTPILLILDGMSVGVTVAGRVARPFVGLDYGRHRLRATTMDYEHEFDSKEIVLSEKEPLKSVTLSVPYSR